MNFMNTLAFFLIEWISNTRSQHINLCFWISDARSQHISLLPVFKMNCLPYICGMSLRDRVPAVVILNGYVKSQLQSKRLRWLGHIFRMSIHRLPNKLLFGEAKGLRLSGRPRSSFNDVALRDCQHCLLVGLTVMHKTGSSGETST